MLSSKEIRSLRLFKCKFDYICGSIIKDPHLPKNIVLFHKARTRLICLAQFLLRHLFLNVNIANY